MKNEIKSGTILIAEPFMHDPNFKRSVVLLCDVHKNGSVGFILNKKTPLPFHELIEGFDPSFSPDVYLGGPVQQDTLHYVHTKGDLIAESKQVAGNIYWGGNFDMLKTLVNQQLITTDDIRFFIGYSGWDADQLENEIEEKSWMLSKINQSGFHMQDEPDELWRKVLIEMGGEYALMANFPENPMLN